MKNSYNINIFYLNQKTKKTTTTTKKKNAYDKNVS